MPIFKRPKRLIITFRCSFSDTLIGEADFNYDPVKMLYKKYSKYIREWKKLCDRPYRDAGMLHGKIKTHIQLIY